MFFCPLFEGGLSRTRAAGNFKKKEPKMREKEKIPREDRESADRKAHLSEGEGNLSSSSKKGGGKWLSLDLVRELSVLLTELSLSEIEVEEKGCRVRVGSAKNIPFLSHHPMNYSVSGEGSTSPSEKKEEKIDLEKHPGLVSSPMIGTVYLAPEPGAPPFIRVGDFVTEGQTLLIIEAMKTMNQIPAPKGGKVLEILVKDTQPVEYAEPLLVLE